MDMRYDEVLSLDRCERVTVISQEFLKAVAAEGGLSNAELGLAA